MQLNNLKIFGLVNKNSGPGMHRIIMPLVLMKNVDCYVTNAITEEDFEKRRPDAIYYNRTISDEILRLQGKYHFRIVVDVDDYWHLDPHHIMFRYSRDNNIPAHQEKHLRIADVVTTTHERLAEKVYPLNKNVVVVPNAIPKHDWFPTIRVPSGAGHRRVFWQGSVTHEADIKMLEKTIKRLDPSRFMMVMCGYTEQVEWERMADVYTNRKKMPGVVLPGLPPHEYYKNYQYADVAVVPLLSTKFNQYKSNLKILEAANVGVPVIASNVHPYKNIPHVLYVNSKEDWYRWLNDEEALAESGGKLKDWCDRNYNFEEINDRSKASRWSYDRRVRTGSTGRVRSGIPY
jgi:glycosyltransferase involved in cell wall biosynthesis